MTGTLYVVPTPLGNLEDMTLRAIRVLEEVSLIAAEDTRHSRPLLTHFGISTRLISYHQHSKRSSLARLLKALDAGDVALITDAGTPSISDPGYELISAAVEGGRRVEVLPGASAIVTAIVAACLPARGFVAMGFLPRAREEAKSRLLEVERLPYSLVIFESPHRLVSTLRTIRAVLGDRAVAAAKEMTKLHAQVFRGSTSEVVAALSNTEIRGEWTVVVGPAVSQPRGPSDDEIAGALGRLRAAGETGRDAVRLVSEMLRLSRSDVYRVWVTLPPDS